MRLSLAILFVNKSRREFSHKTDILAEVPIVRLFHQEGEGTFLYDVTGLSSEHDAEGLIANRIN